MGFFDHGTERGAGDGRQTGFLRARRPFSDPGELMAYYAAEVVCVNYHLDCYGRTLQQQPP